MKPQQPRQVHPVSSVKQPLGNGYHLAQAVRLRLQHLQSPQRQAIQLTRPAGMWVLRFFPGGGFHTFNQFLIEQSGKRLIQGAGRKLHPSGTWVSTSLRMA